MENGPVPDLNTIISLHGAPRSDGSAFGTPSTERTLYTPSVSPNCTIYPSEPTNSSESMRQQSVLKSCISNDPDILRLAEIVTRDKFLVQPPEDLLIAQFYSIKRVPGTSQPKSNKKKATANVRPVNLLEYNCLWCIKWIGYSKEKARNHILSHLEIKNARCQEPGCNWSSVRRSDLVRHLQVTHNQSKSGKKSGGPMRATPSFLELQGVYKFNTETILANAERCSTSPSYYQPDLMQWITYIPDTNENRPMSTANSQVCPETHTWCCGKRLVLLVSSPSVIFYMPEYNVCLSKRAEHFNSDQIESNTFQYSELGSFLCLPFLLFVLLSFVLPTFAYDSIVKTQKKRSTPFGAT